MSLDKILLATTLWIILFFVLSPLHELIHVILLSLWNVGIVDVQWFCSLTSLPHVTYYEPINHICLVLNQLWDIMVHPTLGTLFLWRIMK